MQSPLSILRFLLREESLNQRICQNPDQLLVGIPCGATYGGRLKDFFFSLISVYPQRVSVLLGNCLVKDFFASNY